MLYVLYFSIINQLDFHNIKIRNIKLKTDKYVKNV